MRKTLILAAGLALVATSAWSQSPSRDRDDENGRGDWRDRHEWSRDRDDRRGRSMRDDEEGVGRGASFFLRSGDTQLRVICDDRESTRACVDAALTMFERLRSQPGASSSSSQSSGSPPPR